MPVENYNHELKACITGLRDKRDLVARQICDEEAVRDKLNEQIQNLNKRLALVHESLARKNETKTEYDKTIEETEAAYKKIMQSSHTLLHVLKRETEHLEKRQDL